MSQDKAGAERIKLKMNDKLTNKQNKALQKKVEHLTQNNKMQTKYQAGLKQQLENVSN